MCDLGGGFTIWKKKISSFSTFKPALRSWNVTHFDPCSVLCLQVMENSYHNSLSFLGIMQMEFWSSSPSLGVVYRWLWAGRAKLGLASALHCPQLYSTKATECLCSPPMAYIWIREWGFYKPLPKHTGCFWWPQRGTQKKWNALRVLACVLFCSFNSSFMSQCFSGFLIFSL